MEENIALIVSFETNDRTAAESVRPSSENRHTAARFGEMVEAWPDGSGQERWTSVPPKDELH